MTTLAIRRVGANLKRRAANLALGLAAATFLAGCSHDDVRYPRGWAPIIDTPPGCPDLVGSWRPDATGDPAHAFGALARTILPHVSLLVRWNNVTIEPDPHGGVVLAFHRLAAHSTSDATVLPLHLDLDPASCSGGMLTVRRREPSGGEADYHLGRNTAGELVVQRLANEREPLLHWGDTTLLSGPRGLRASWGRLPAGVVPGNPPAAATTPRAPAASIAVVAAPPPPPPLLPVAPPTRAGALPMGEAQAIVLSALPETAVFLGMTPTPRGYSLRVSALDAKAMALFKRRLAIDGHFELPPETSAPPASGASAPADAPAPAPASDVTLELVERVLR